MATTTKISFEEFQKLQETADETVRYELDEGDLILTPAPTPWHNIVALRLSHALKSFVKKHQLGIVITEVDFRLSRAIRSPDVAFIAKGHIQNLDLHHTPIEGAPSLAIEVISPSNLAQDTLKKVHQYLSSGCKAVWLVYPPLGIIEVHDVAGIREVTAPNPFNEERLFPNLTFSLSLSELFDEDPQR